MSRAGMTSSHPRPQGPGSGEAIPYGRQWIGEDDILSVAEALRSDYLTTGPSVERFERAVAEYLGCRHCIAVANGTAALHVAMLALGVKEGDVGLTSPITFLASANAVAYCGARPDFVDIDGSRCLSAAALEAYLEENPAPRVVVPVDFAGLAADLPAIWRLKGKYGFHVVEDAAHSLGSSYAYTEADGTAARARCGSCRHSDLAVLSFHPVKTITTGEGGMICTNDPELARVCRSLVSHGMERNPDRMKSPATPRVDGRVPEWYYEMHGLGFNYRITDLQCALGTSQLAKLGDFKRKRMDAAVGYTEALAPLERAGWIRLPRWADAQDPCLHLYALELDGPLRGARDRVYADLRRKGILCQVHYIPVYLQPWYRETFGYLPGKCPRGEAYFEGCLSLPLYPALTAAQRERVESAFAETLQSIGASA